MMAPFYKLGAFGDEAALLIAFVVGIGFGFFLERAGFGSARKLVAQFYLRDLAVFKVMFSAIVTAMLGLTYLAWTGYLDLSRRERAALETGVGSLPQSLAEALDAMEGSDLVREALGDHIFEWFLRNKRAEWFDYKTQVTPFELARYLRNW